MTAGGNGGNARSGYGGYLGYGPYNGGIGGSGYGGAIYVNSGSITVSSDQFTGNSAMFGMGGLPAGGSNGANGSVAGLDIHCLSDAVSVNNSVFDFYYPFASDAAESTVTVSPAELLSNGTASSIVTVTLYGANGYSAGSGKTVTLTSDSATALISPASAVTDGYGCATFSVADTEAGTVTYTARDATYNVAILQTATVQYLPPDMTLSTVTADSTSLPANASDATTVTVTLTFPDGTAAAGKTITLSSPNGSSGVSPGSVITDADGSAVFTVISAISGAITYTATDTTDGISLDQTATIDFAPYDWIVSSLEDTDTLGTLRHATGNAPEGAYISFQSGLSGTIVLLSPLPVIDGDMTIDGEDADITISGANLYRVFEVDSGTVAINNLTVRNGRAAGSNGPNSGYGHDAGAGANGVGGGLLIMDGAVSISNVTFDGNSAVGGTGGYAAGGWCASGNGGNAYGGGVYIHGGALTIMNSAFNGNSAIGGSGGNGGNQSGYGAIGGNGGTAYGGAIYIDAGSLMVADSSFNGSSAVGGNGGSGGSGSKTGADGGGGGTPYGGTIFSKAGSLVLSDIQSADSSLAAGQGGTGGGAGQYQLGSDGAAGGAGRGSDLFNSNGPMLLANVTMGSGENSYFNSSPADAAKSTVTANPLILPADGSTFSTITVALRDANGNGVSAKRIRLTSDEGGSIISPSATAKTNNAGTATFTVTDTTDEIITYTVTDATDNITVAQAAMVGFGDNIHILTYRAEEHGSITGTTPQVVDDEGSGSEIRAVADSGYYFESWSDGTTDNPRTDSNVTADVDVTASFAPITLGGGFGGGLGGGYEGGWTTTRYTGEDDTVKFGDTMDGGGTITYGVDAIIFETLGVDAGRLPITDSVDLPFDSTMRNGDFVYTIRLDMTDVEDLEGTAYGQGIKVSFGDAADNSMSIAWRNLPVDAVWSPNLCVVVNTFDDTTGALSWSGHHLVEESSVEVCGLGGDGAGNISLRLDLSGDYLTASYLPNGGEWTDITTVDMSTDTTIDPASDWTLSVFHFGADAAWLSGTSHVVDEISVDFTGAEEATTDATTTDVPVADDDGTTCFIDAL